MTARSERPIRRLISWVRPPMRPLTDSRSERVLVAPGSMAYSAVTQPRPGALAPARHALGGRGGAQHAGAAELDQHRAGGVVEPVAGDRDRAELVVGAAVLAGSHGATLARADDGDRSTRPDLLHLGAQHPRPARATNGSTSQIRTPVTSSCAHSSPVDGSPRSNSGCCAVPKSIHGATSREPADQARGRSDDGDRAGVDEVDVTIAAAVLSSSIGRRRTRAASRADWRAGRRRKIVGRRGPSTPVAGHRRAGCRATAITIAEHDRARRPRTSAGDELGRDHPAAARLQGEGHHGRCAGSTRW